MSKPENYIVLTRNEIISAYGTPTDYKRALENATEACEDYEVVFICKVEKMVRQPKAPPEVVPFTLDLFSEEE